VRGCAEGENADIAPRRGVKPKDSVINDMLDHCLPNKERAVIPSASHGLEYENPQAFNDTVLAFIARH
jgi:non-heme chloroperoxidase